MKKKHHCLYEIDPASFLAAATSIRDEGIAFSVRCPEATTPPMAAHIEHDIQEVVAGASHVTSSRCDVDETSARLPPLFCAREWMWSPRSKPVRFPAFPWRNILKLKFLGVVDILWSCTMNYGPIGAV